MPVEVSCPCGMRSRGPDSLAGKQAKCPQCGNVLNIPHLQQAPVLLTPLEPQPAASRPIWPAGAPAAPQPMRQPAPLGYASLQQANLASLPTYDPLARPLASQQQAESGGIPAGVWIGLVCGAGGAVVAALIAIIAVSMSSGGPPVVPPDAVAAVNVPVPIAPPPTATVAVPPPMPVSPSPSAMQSVSATPAATASPSPSLPTAPSLQPAPTSSSVGSSSSASTAPASTPMTSPELARAMASATGGLASGDSGRSPTAGSASEAPLALLKSGTDRWRTSPKSNLRGMQRFPDKMPSYGYSWMVEVLPYLGHEKVYAQFDLKKSWAEGRNLSLTSAVIPAFINPADDRVRSTGYPVSGMGLTHFVGMAGIEDTRNVVAGELPRTDPRAGIFGYDEVARPEAITDGQSNTIMLIGAGNLPAPWVQGGGATVRGARAPYFDEITGFGSKGLASSGSLVMMADGSVKAISANIDPPVFRAMCTMHGAESVDLESVPFLPAETK